MQDLSSVFPSRDALREWMRAGAMLNVCMHVSVRACSFLSADVYQDLSPEEKLVLWRFGRSSDTAKTVKSKWDDFHNRVQQVCTTTSYAMHHAHATHARHTPHTHTHTFLHVHRQRCLPKKRGKSSRRKRPRVW